MTESDRKHSPSSRGAGRESENDAVASARETCILAGRDPEMKHQDTIDRIHAFAARAEAFCTFLEGAHLLPHEVRLRTLAAHLADLFSAAVRLPNVGPGDRDWPDRDIEMPTWKWLGQLETYNIVFDPYEHVGVDWGRCCGFLTDDVFDIYRDLQRGLVPYRADCKDGLFEASWSWRWHFENHFGHHIVTAMGALYSAIEWMAGPEE